MNRNWKALILYIFLAVVFTWPLLPKITTHYPSTLQTEGGDPNMYIWVMNAAAEKVMHPSFHPSQMIFYPDGLNFAASYEAPIILPIGVPIVLLTHNPVLAYNFVLLLAIILTAYCSYLLVLYLTDSWFAAVISGFTFGFSPYMMVRSTQHLDLLFLFTIALVVLFALKSVESPTRKNLAWLVFAVVLTALSAWYYLVGSLIFLIVLGLLRFKQFWAHKREWIIAIGSMAVLLFIVALPMILNKSNSNLGYADLLVWNRGADPVNFFIPHPFTQSWSWPFYKTLASPFESTSYFGFVGVIAIFALAFPKRIQIPNRNLWISVIVVFTVIAMGTQWTLFGHNIWLPFNWLRKLPLFDRLRAPNRFFVFAYLSTTIAFGYFLAKMRVRFAGKNIGTLLTIGLILLLASERFIFPYPLYSVSVNEFYKTIGQDKEQYAIVDLPIVDPGRSLYNYFQMTHHKPLVAGEYFWTAYNDHTFDFIDRNRLLDFSFTNSCSEVLPLAPGSREKALKQLSDNNVRYVVVHSLLFQFDDCPKVLGFVHDFFKGQKPIFSDGEITVYSTTNP